MKNPMRVAAGLRGSAKGFQRASAANYSDFGPILLMQSEHRKNSRRARAQLYKLLRMGR